MKIEANDVILDILFSNIFSVFNTYEHKEYLLKYLVDNMVSDLEDLNKLFLSFDGILNTQKYKYGYDLGTTDVLKEMMNSIDVDVCLSDVK